MLVMHDTNFTFNATSQDEAGHPFASMSASYSGGSVYFNLTVDHNDPAVDQDFADFKESVFTSVGLLKD